jgi:hypothetical protein
MGVSRSRTLASRYRHIRSVSRNCVHQHEATPTLRANPQAVRIPRPRVVAQFSQGLPAPMLAARLTFFITVAIMVVFGVAPVADSTARIGIIACVFALVGVAVLNFALERHHVNTGHAKEMDVSSSGNV